MTDPTVRAQALRASMVSQGVLEGGIRIPNTVGDMHVNVDLRAGQITCHVDLEAPKEGRPATRVNWLLKQLRQAPDTVRVEAFTTHQRGPGATAMVPDIRANPTTLVADAKKELRSFRIAMTVPMGSKRGRGRGAFIDSLLAAVDGFYGDVLQHLKAWAAAPPKMREPVETPPVSPKSLASTAQSSQDGPERVQDERADYRSINRQTADRAARN
jgi:hypothetical protein